MVRTIIDTADNLRDIFNQAYISDHDFNIPVSLENRSASNLTFYNCKFNKKFTFLGYKQDLIFENCHFQELNFQYALFVKKVRFRECHFHKETNFTNTKFNDLADFWRSIFHKKTIFYKTDFLGTTVFSAVEFRENVLFTYTLIDRLIIFRGTNFNKGLDLSLAIISGSIGVFDLKITHFTSLHINNKIEKGLSSEDHKSNYEEMYENAVSQDANIPIENKLETFRIIKKRLQDQGNNIMAIDFNVLEKGALKEMIQANPI